MTEEGLPALLFICDCATGTLAVIDDAPYLEPGTREFAITCEGCGTPHWAEFTIRVAD